MGDEPVARTQQRTAPEMTAPKTVAKTVAQRIAPERSATERTAAGERFGQGTTEEPTTTAGKNELIRRRARRLAWLYTAAAVALLPWIIYLADTLPRYSVDRHYRGAWVGFDIILAITIIITAYYAFRVDPRVQFPATATAVLLFVDAWFDVTTSPTRQDFAQAFILAVFAEIPAAIFSLVVAHRVNRRSSELARLHRDSHLPHLRHGGARQSGPPAASSSSTGSSTT